MELLFIVGILMCLVLLGQFVTFHRIAELRKEYAEVHDQLASTEAEESFLSDAQIERNQAFQARIEKIKDELARQDNTERVGYSADELHPSVKNLPHNIIAQEHSHFPDVEYAE